MVTFVDSHPDLQPTARQARLGSVIAVIPAYNAEATIDNVVRLCRRRVVRCVVVDDGSTDQTGRNARRAGADLIVHVGNRGKGAAIRSALAYLQSLPFDYAVLLDADGQHDPGEIAQLVNRARHSHADVICGTRMANPEGMPWLRRVTNRTMSWILSKLIGVKLSDTQCGYRVLSERAAKSIVLTKSNFEVESEMLLDAARRGLKIQEARIRSVYGPDHSSHISPARDTWRFIKLLAGLLVARMKPLKTNPPPEPAPIHEKPEDERDDERESTAETE